MSCRSHGFGKGRARRARVAWASLPLLLLYALPATSTEIRIGGKDGITQYTAPSGSDPGVLTFSDSGGSPGLVDEDSDVGLLPVGAEVFFEAELSSEGAFGSGPFDASTDNILLAQFERTSNITFRITDGEAIPTTLLTFDLVNADTITVSTAIAASGNDPDGRIGIGSLTVGVGGNELELTGGALAAQYGGVGSKGYLLLGLDSPDPAILSNADLNGYFGQDFTSGNGLLNAPTVWDLAIIPIPEPGTAPLLALALVGLGALRARRIR